MFPCLSVQATFTKNETNPKKMQTLQESRSNILPKIDRSLKTFPLIQATLRGKIFSIRFVSFVFSIEFVRKRRMRRISIKKLQDKRRTKKWRTGDTVRKIIGTTVSRKRKRIRENRTCRRFDSEKQDTDIHILDRYDF